MIQALASSPVLMAEDDKDDRYLTEKAFQENRVQNPLVTVANGEELIDYLYRRGKFTRSPAPPMPCLILLDLNMPRMGGREALRIIKADENLRKIPVVILSTSKSPEDLLGSYDGGANSFINKPVTFEGLVKVVRSLKDYWLEIVDLPHEKATNNND